jgi:hypothetical protein
MKNTVKILSLILLLSSCRTDVPKDESLDVNTNTSATNDTESSRHKFLSVNETPTKTENVKWQQIQFADLTIFLEEIEMGWDEMYRTKNDSVYSTISDTAYFDLWPGDWFFDKEFKVDQPEFDKIDLYEKITFNMAMNSNSSIVKEDVPFCVIYNWKTFESEWSQIQLDNDELKFMSNEEGTNAVINFTVEEFKAAVKEHCGIDWYNEIKDIKSTDKLPSELFTSSYTFKIVARNSKTGRVVEKFIIFNPPTSC